MNLDRVKGNWKQLRGKAKVQWGNLTDDELDIIDGRRDVLIGKVQERYGISKDEAAQQVEEFEARHLAGAAPEEDYAAKSRMSRNR